MNIFHVILLSIIEGVTEFLPISSTGHLNLAQVVLGIPKTDFFTTFEIFIQLGAILAVVVLYFKKVLADKEIWKKVAVSFIPTGIIGLILGKFIKHYLTNNEVITTIALLVGGFILIILELIYKEKEHHSSEIKDISYKNAFLIGVSQSIAVIPGVLIK